MRGQLNEAIPNAVTMQFNTPHPDNVYDSWLWSGKSPFSRWENEEFVAKGEQARQLTDVEEATKLYREMSAMAVQDAAVIPIFTTRYACATTAGVNDVGLPPSGWNYLITLNDTYVQD